MYSHCVAIVVFWVICARGHLFYPKFHSVCELSPIEECLNHSTWNIHKEHSTLTHPKPTTSTTNTQMTHTTTPYQSSCSLYGKAMTNPKTTPTLQAGNNTAKLTLLWKSSSSSSPLAATRVMTGLQLLNSSEANASLLKVAVLTLSKICIETGFVGAPLAGMSRAERAPHLSNS